jgi:hypothetical protein
MSSAIGANAQGMGSEESSVLGELLPDRYEIALGHAARGNLAGLQAAFVREELNERQMGELVYQAAARNEAGLLEFLTEGLTMTPEMRGMVLAGAAVGGQWARVERTLQEGEISDRGWGTLLAEAVRAGRGDLVTQALQHNVEYTYVALALTHAVNGYRWDIYEEILRRHPNGLTQNPEATLRLLFALRLDEQRQRIADQLTSVAQLNWGVVAGEALKRNEVAFASYIIGRHPEIREDVVCQVGLGGILGAKMSLDRRKALIDILVPELKSKSLSKLPEGLLRHLLLGAVKANHSELIEAWAAERSLAEMTWHLTAIYAAESGNEECLALLVRAAVDQQHVGWVDSFHQVRQKHPDAKQETMPEFLKRMGAELTAAPPAVAPAPQPQPAPAVPPAPKRIYRSLSIGCLALVAGLIVLGIVLAKYKMKS